MPSARQIGGLAAFQSGLCQHLDQGKPRSHAMARSQAVRSGDRYPTGIHHVTSECVTIELTCDFCYCITTGYILTLQEGDPMAKIGYARVSSLDQDHATQEARLRAAGCEIVRKEKASGRTLPGRDR